MVGRLADKCKCYWVESGKFLAGEYPRNLDEESSLEKIAALKDAGVGLFIDLTEEREKSYRTPTPLAPYAQWVAPARHVRFPIPDHEPPVTPEQAAAILDAIDDCIAFEKVAYVHCQGGVGRTGAVVGCWLARRLGSGQEALDRLQELWASNPKYYRDGVDCSPRQDSQIEYILTWPENDPRGTGGRDGR